MRKRRMRGSEEWKNIEESKCYSTWWDTDALWLIMAVNKGLNAELMQWIWDLYGMYVEILWKIG